jgi:hypothetical protein
LSCTNLQSTRQMTLRSVLLFKFQTPSLLSILSLALYSFLVTFLFKCFLDPFYAMSEEWRKVYQSGSSRLNSWVRKRQPVKLSPTKDVEEKNLILYIVGLPPCQRHFIQKLTVDKTCKKCRPFNDPELSSCKSNQENLLQARWIQYASLCNITPKYISKLSRNTVKVSVGRSSPFSYCVRSVKFRIKINEEFAHPVPNTLQVFYCVLLR